MKYARATWWIFLAWVARRVHLPKRVVENLEDEASMAMFACSLDFQEVKVVTAPEQLRREIANQHRGEVIPGSGVPVEPKLFAPRTVGYRCRHLTVTAGGAISSLGPVSAWCGCAMDPVTS